MINIGPASDARNLASVLGEFVSRMEASKRSDLPPSSPGPELVHLDEGWIPQGQAYDASEGHLFSTYNRNGHVLASVQDADSTEGELTHAILGAPPPPDDLHGWERTAFIEAATAPDKGGGIAVDGDNVYVADTQGVYRYALEDIRNAAPGETVPALDYQPTEGNASYITIHDGHAYVGQFGVEEGGYGSADYGTDPSLTRYEIADDGRLVDPLGPIETPPYAQGVAVTERGLLYTTSLGSNPDESPHALVYQPFADFEAFEPQTRVVGLFGFTFGESQVFHQVLTLDHYAEELSIVGNEVWVTYESNAQDYVGKYRDNVGATPGNDTIQRIPLSALDLTGTGVSAEQLEAAAHD